MDAVVDIFVLVNFLLQFCNGVVNLEEGGTVFGESLGALTEQLEHMPFVFYFQQTLHFGDTIGGVAGVENIQQHAKRVHITGCPKTPMEHHLGCDITRSATGLSFDNCVGRVQLDGEPKINEFDGIGFGINHDVVWFHITVNNVFGMHVNHGGRNLSADQHHVCVRNVIIRNQIVECNAFGMFHNDYHFGGRDGVPKEFYNPTMPLKRIQDTEFIDKHPDPNPMLHNLVDDFLVLVFGGKHTTKLATPKIIGRRWQIVFFDLSDPIHLLKTNKKS